MKARVGTLQPKPAAAGGQFVRSTEDARLAIFFARAWSRKLESEVIDSQHLLLGLVDANAKLVDRLLGDRLETEFAIRREIDRRKPTHEKITDDLHRPVSGECKRVLQHASDEADRLNHDRISTGHFLLGILLEKKSFAASILIDIFSAKGMRVDKVRASIVDFLNQTAL